MLLTGEGLLCKSEMRYVFTFFIHVLFLLKAPNKHLVSQE